MENNVRHPNKKLSSIHTASIIVNESDYSEINDKTPIETLGISMSKENKKKKLEFDIPKSKEGNGIKKRINTEGEDPKGIESLANSIGNIIDKKEFKLGERTNLLLKKNPEEKKAEEKKEKENKKKNKYRRRGCKSFRFISKFNRKFNR